MSGKWVAWSERNKEFAPVVGLHKHHLFYPTGIEAFFKGHIELIILEGMQTGGKGPLYVSIRDFPKATMTEKIQYMLHPKANRKTSHLNRFGGKHDIKQSHKLQKGEPRQIYARGFRNKSTREAYITYWFFYLENFVPRSLSDSRIAEVLKTKPDGWWTHEGDWEAISMHFSDYESSTPDEVFFSQHGGAAKRLWKNAGKEGGRVLVIPAIGSHASFFEPVRKKHAPPLSFAEVASADVLTYPAHSKKTKVPTYKLKELDPTFKHRWLHFKGRWGQSSGEMFPAPTGPLMKRRKHFKLLSDV